MSSFEPYAFTCSNPHRDDYWTCPGCYVDLGNIGKGDHTCPNCSRKIHCSVEYRPACLSRLIETEEDLDQ